VDEEVESEGEGELWEGTGEYCGKRAWERCRRREVYAWWKGVDWGTNERMLVDNKVRSEIFREERIKVSHKGNRSTRSRGVKGDGIMKTETKVRKGERR
jgi:hypothetical protein